MKFWKKFPKGKHILAYLLVLSLVLPMFPTVSKAAVVDDYDSMTMKQILGQDKDKSLTWVFSGDSITHNGTWSQGMNSYSEWFEQYLADIGRINDEVVLTAWGGASVTNFLSTSGDPGYGLENMITKYNPDVVFIKLGMNERGRTAQQFIDDMQKVIDGVYSAGAANGKKAKIILLSTTPMSSDTIYNTDQTNQNTAWWVRDAMETVATKNNLTFVDFVTAFTQEALRLGDDYHFTFYSDPSDGGIHPNMAGQYFMFKTLSKALEIYDETLPIYQLEYEDLLNAALWTDDTNDVKYVFSDQDEMEMERDMPLLSDSDPKPIAWADTNSINGVFYGMSANYFIDLTDKTTWGNGALTLDKVQQMGKEYSIVFRAKLKNFNGKANQPVFYLSTNKGTAFNGNTHNVLAVGVPNNNVELYYSFREKNVTKVNGGDGQLAMSNVSNFGKDNTWHDIAIVQGASDLKLYVDGKLTYTLAKSLSVNIGSLFTSVTSFDAAIGRLDTTSDNSAWRLQGLMDFFQLYDEALSDEQVAELSVDYEVKTEQPSADWSSALKVNSLWSVAGAEQMFGYEGSVVNRSLFRLIDNTMRNNAGVDYRRDIRLLNVSAPGYTVEKILENYEELIDSHNPDVFLLLPEVSEVYSDGYHPSTDKVEAYKKTVEELMTKSKNKVRILWTPLASGDDTINGYLADYVNAIRQIAASDSTILFFDAYDFMIRNIKSLDALHRNWFDEDMYLSPLGALDVAKGFYTYANGHGFTYTPLGELNNHNLRLTSDKRMYKGSYVRDYIGSKATVSGTNITVDVSAIQAAYPGVTNLRLAVMPYVNAGNYHKDIYNLDVSLNGSKFTFEAPCSDPIIAVYGDLNGKIYRFKDLEVEVSTSNTIPEPNPTVELTDLEVVGASDLGFSPDKTSYDSIELHQYQRSVQVKATAQKGLTITVNGKEVESGYLSQLIDVNDGENTTITVTVSKAGERKTYTLTLNPKPDYPDIIITEVMQDGYGNYTVSGGDNYELIEVYNASGRELNLLDYSIGYKRGYAYDTFASNGGKWPYYFTGNDHAFDSTSGTGAKFTGINQITKYSTYWNGGNNKEPEKIPFPADSTMVIWVKFTPSGASNTYGSSLTYDTLIKALTTKATDSTPKTRTIEVNGEIKAVVPTLDQLVVAEIPQGVTAAALSDRNRVLPQNAQKNFYLDNHTAGNTTNTQVLSWLFVLDKGAKMAVNGAITEAGNDIVSASKFVRIEGGSNALSSVFSYDVDRGMSVVKNEAVYGPATTSVGFTSDQYGYRNLTTFGAVEYWQKPYDLDDTQNPMVDNKTPSLVAKGAESEISLDITDNEDIRYLELYVRKAGESEFTKIARDLVLEAGVTNAGVSEDIKEMTYSYAVGAVTDKVEYYVVVVDGNNNKTTLGSAASPLKIATSEALRIEVEYSKEEALKYVGVEAPKCDGYLFAGWYVDEECVTTPIRNRDEVTDKAYALFVDPEVLSVKAQITDFMEDADATNDETGALRFVTSADSLNYREIGFKIAFDKNGTGNKTKQRIASNQVYTQLYAVSMDPDDENKTVIDTLYPSEFSALSNYFKACTVRNIPESYYELEFEVTPFWVTMDGREVDGVSDVKVINDRIGAKYAAKDDAKYYDTLDNAVEAINAQQTNKITVMSSDELHTQLTLASGRDVVVQGRENRSATIYRGSEFSAKDMISVQKGATLTIKGMGEEGKLVFDGRTETEANAGTARDSAAGSTAPLISNCGDLTLERVTVQYVRKINERGGVISNNYGQTTSNADAMVTIKDSTFDNNYSKSFGSVVYSVAKVVITDSTFTNNKSDNNGGVLCHHGGSLFTVDTCEFKNNEGLQGGAIWINKFATIENCTFDSNTGTSGGAFYNNNSNTQGAALTGNKFISNTGTSGGGAIYNYSGTNLTLSGNTFTGNRATGAGGAIYNSGGNLILTDNVFNGNTATGNGGAVFMSGAEPILTNCTFKGNTSGAQGGGVMNNVGTTVVFTDCKFYGNTATTNGGGFYGALSGIITFKVGDHPDNAVFENNTAENIGTAQQYGGGGVCIGSGTLTVENYTFKNNVTNITSETAYEANGGGGAIRMNNTTTSGYATPLIVKGCTFESNTSQNYGGAISSKCVAKIETSDFTGNVATYRGGALFGNNTTTIENCTWDNNSAVREGGAVFGNAGLTVTGNEFTGNSSTEYRAGAIYANGVTTVTDCTFESNSSNQEGGAICSYNTLTITDCKFVKNVSTAHRGAGAYLGGGKVFTFAGNDASKAIFQENTAKQGGAICLGSGTLNVTGYTFESNSSTEAVGGGAIKLNDANTIANLTECAFKNNKGQKGGAICADANASGTGSLTITDCTFEANKANDSSTFDNKGGGAIWANKNVTINLVGKNPQKARFEGNTSKWQGGAICFKGTLTGSGYTFGTSDTIYNDGGENRYE